MINDIKKLDKRHVLSRLIYPLGLLLSKVPTLVYGICELNPLKVVWREKYRQSYPNCVWFFKYPNHLNVMYIGKNSTSGNAIILAHWIPCYIGNNTTIGRNLKILPRAKSGGHYNR